MARFREILKNRNFMLLWVAQLISNFGDRLNQMALIALVYQRSPGSEMELAKLISFTIIPVFIIGPFAGVWVDRFDRRSIMIISDITRGALVLLIPAFIYTGHMPPIYLIIFLTFSISRFFIPSKMAIIPDIVREETLLLANTLQGTTHMIGNVIGLVVAAVIVTLPRIGAVGGFYIDSASFFISAALIAMIIKKTAPQVIEDDIKKAREALKSPVPRTVIRDIGEGMRCLWRYPQMRFVVAAFFVLMAGIGAVSCLAIVFIQEAFGNATRDLGFIGMFLVGGLFLGTVLYGRLGQRLEKRGMVSISFMLTGAALTLFVIGVAVYKNSVLAWMLSALVGCAVSPIMISVTTITHEVIPEDVRGRIFSSLEAVIHFAFLICMFFAAVGARYLGRSWVLGSVGVIFIGTGIAGKLFDKKTHSLT